MVKKDATATSNISYKNKQFYNRSYFSFGIMHSLVAAYSSYDQQSKAKRNWKILKSYLFKKTCFPNPLYILDYGFGRGSFLIKVPKTWQVYGCELSERAIKNLRKTFKFLKKNVHLFCPDEMKDELKDIKFDIISCSHVLEHLDDDTAMIQRFAEHLKNNAVLLLNVPINEIWKDPNHIHGYTQEALCKNLIQNGFAINSSLEADRWTAFILYNEKHAHSFIKKLLFRFLRLNLALLPISVLDSFEWILPAQYCYQQLIITAIKF